MSLRKTLLTLLLAGLLSICAASASVFTDVPAGASYAPAVSWCVEKQLMNGVGNGRFNPNGTLDRATLATVLYRASGKPAITTVPAFTDVRAGLWYSDAVAWAAGAGILQGVGGNHFNPAGPVTQVQLDVIMRRYQGENPDWPGDPTEKPATRAEVAVALQTHLKDQMDALAAGKKVLVAYFSESGNTRDIAGKIAGATGGTLFELVPETPYSKADLNYSNSDCRAKREQDNPGTRPVVASVVEDLENYDTVFLGYPIWFGAPPKIVSTFLESYDFSDKTVIPFCTSGSSPYSDSGLPELAKGADWVTGRRFTAGAAASEVSDWVKGLALSVPEAKLNVSFNGHTYSATLAGNEPSKAFAALLKKNGGSIEVEAADYGGFEKSGALPSSLTGSDEAVDAVPGDLILYHGNRIVLCYGENSWTITRLGRLDGDLSSLKENLGDGDVTITYALAE